MSCLICSLSQRLSHLWKLPTTWSCQNDQHTHTHARRVIFAFNPSLQIFQLTATLISLFYLWICYRTEIQIIIRYQIRDNKRIDSLLCLNNCECMHVFSPLSHWNIQWSIYLISSCAVHREWLGMQHQANWSPISVLMRWTWSSPSLQSYLHFPGSKLNWL